jgi:phosphatidylserine/phosphatidylglycerophosphate/cardiolipin synthase-like enzyme
MPSIVLRFQVSILAVFLGFFQFSSFALAVQLFDNSKEAPHLSLIQSARSSIDIEIYTLGDALIREALQSAQNRGVRVRLLLEPSPVGASCHVFDGPKPYDPVDCPAIRDFANSIRIRGGTALPFNKSAFCTNGNCFQHGKLMIIDSKKALISTGNFDATSICDIASSAQVCNRDFSVVTDDLSEISSLRAVFESDLKGSPYDLGSIVQSLKPGSLTISPYSMDPLVSFINGSKRTLQIENQYLKDPTLNQAVFNAGLRGVHVEVMVEDLCHFGWPTDHERAKLQALSDGFDQARIFARAFTKSISIGRMPGYLHAKAIVVDQTWAWVGSVNGSTGALTKNREFGIFFTDRSQVAKLSQTLASDFRASGSVSLKENVNCVHSFF